jgi:F-type H+-transporting ATPase subunit b
MNFDLTTFILEIINFFVLLWLLQKFLYKPILKVINDRQAAIDKKVEDARLAVESAHDLEAQYGARLGQWEKEKSELVLSLQQELERQRQRQLNKIKEEIEGERQRSDTLWQAEKEEHKIQCEREAVKQAAQLAEKVFGRLASPDLEKRICQLFLAELDQTKKISLDSAANMGNHERSQVQVTTAFPLPDDLRTSITSKIGQLVGDEPRFQFAEDPSLIAGLRITAGMSVLQANLRDAVNFFENVQD